MAPVHTFHWRCETVLRMPQREVALSIALLTCMVVSGCKPSGRVEEDAKPSQPSTQTATAPTPAIHAVAQPGDSATKTPQSNNTPIIDETPSGDDHSAIASGERVIVVAPPYVASANLHDAVLGDLVGEVMAVALAEDKAVAVVERRNLNLILSEQRLTLNDLTKSDAAATVGKLLSADVVVAGTITPEGHRLHCVYHVIGVEGHAVLGSAEVKGHRDSIETMVLELSSRLGKIAGSSFPEVRPEELDDSPIGRLHLMRGIGLYYSGNLDQAIAYCLQAVQLDPRLYVARLWIARSYLALNEVAHARAELERLQQNPAADNLHAEITQLLAVCNETAKKPTNPE